MNKRVAQHLRNLARTRSQGENQYAAYKRLKKLYYEKKREGAGRK